MNYDMRGRRERLSKREKEGQEQPPLTEIQKAYNGYAHRIEAMVLLISTSKETIAQETTRLARYERVLKEVRVLAAAVAPLCDEHAL